MKRRLYPILAGGLIALMLLLMVFLTIGNMRRDIQVDQVSIEDRARLHAHDEEQDLDRHNLQQQVQELRDRVRALETKK